MTTPPLRCTPRRSAATHLFATLVMVVVALNAHATTCPNAITINPASLPITNQSLVCGTTNDLNSTNVPGDLCGTEDWDNYKNGYEALYRFTPTSSGSYHISYSGQTWSSIQVFVGCPTDNNCVYGTGSSASTENATVWLTAGIQYFIWFDTWPTPNSPCPGTFSLKMAPPPPGCGQMFYDSGGASGNYQPNENQTFTFCPTTSGHVVSLVFSQFQTESGYDFMYIYAGPSTASPLIGQYSGSTSPGTVISSHSSGCLTVRFTSDASIQQAGWAAQVVCAPPPPPPTCGAQVYDPGGPTGDYGPSTTFTQTVCPTTAGDAVRLVFTMFNTEANYDQLFIYNGRIQLARSSVYSVGTCFPRP